MDQGTLIRSKFREHARTTKHQKIKNRPMTAGVKYPEYADS